MPSFASRSMLSARYRALRTQSTKSSRGLLRSAWSIHERRKRPHRSRACTPKTSSSSTTNSKSKASHLGGWQNSSIRFMRRPFMRPIRLEMEGFTSFKKHVEVDFADMALFAITGPTGAGKTSLIDGLIYALYGSTPRLGKSASDLISQGQDNLRVLLEFSSGSKRYRVSRHIRRTKRSIVNDVRLEEWEGEKWAPRADKVNQAEAMIEKIVGLDFNGFTKSVVLPQGRFDEFLKGKPDERRKILSELLQLEVYSRMMKRANEIAQDHKTKLELLESHLKTDFADATPELVASLEEELGRFTNLLGALMEELERVQALLPDAHRLRQARNEVSSA